MNFISLIHTQFHITVKTIRSDNGAEFHCPSFYEPLGIVHQTSCVETPQENSVVERKHKHIMNVTCSLLFHSSIPNIYWCYAVKHVFHLINRLPTPVLRHKSPFEALHHKPPTLIDLKAFCCLCFSATLTQGRTKLDPKATKCAFLGFKPGTKGYITVHISISRNVVFYENIDKS